MPSNHRHFLPVGVVIAVFATSERTSSRFYRPESLVPSTLSPFSIARSLSRENKLCEPSHAVPSNDRTLNSSPTWSPDSTLRPAARQRCDLYLHHRFLDTSNSTTNRRRVAHTTSPSPYVVVRLTWWLLYDCLILGGRRLLSLELLQNHSTCFRNGVVAKDEGSEELVG